MLLLRSEINFRGGPKTFRFQPHCFEEKQLMGNIESWWREFNFNGNAWFVFHNKLMSLKGRIKNWVKKNLLKP